MNTTEGITGLSLQGRVSRTRLMSTTIPNSGMIKNGRSDTTEDSKRRSMDHENETRISLWHGSRYRNTTSRVGTQKPNPKHPRIVRNSDEGNDPRLLKFGNKDRCTRADRVDVMGASRLAHSHAVRPVVRVDRKKAKGGVMFGVFVTSIVTAVILVALALK